jgi:hypothetical protein
MVIRLIIDYGELVKLALKSKSVGGKRSRWVDGLRVIGAAGFCGPFVCLDAFLLL